MMSTILLIAIISFTCGFVAGLTTAGRIAKVAIDLARKFDFEQPKKKTGVVKMGLNTPIVKEVSNTGVVRPKPPKSEDDDTKSALSSARQRVGM